MHIALDYNGRMDAPHDLTASAGDPDPLAREWFDRITQQPQGMPAECPLPDRWIDAAARLIGLLLESGRSIELVVPDDETLPELSSALDLDVRPLCLVLPEAPFASRIALRATLTLLKSRLARQADHSPLWQRQHDHIAALHGLWQSAQAWNQSETTAPWPAETAHLFPGRLLPASHAAAMQGDADIRILIAPERMQGDLRDQLASHSGQMFCLSAWRRGIEKRQLIAFDETLQQRFELEVLSREIAELELELATAQQEVASFSQRYYEIVGIRMVELDQLQAEIAAAQAAASPTDIKLKSSAAQYRAQAEASAHEQASFESLPHKAPEPVFAPAKDLKKLYRQVAQKIHPDRAENESDRQWRTTLMAEATRAYRSEDMPALQEVMRRWTQGMDTHDQGIASTVTTAAGLALQLQQMKLRLGAIQAELDKLLASRLYELLVANRIATRQGRDLLQEIAKQVDAQIEDAKQALARLTSCTANEGVSPCDSPS